jgi:N-acetylneuraminic acid mutarotase
VRDIAAIVLAALLLVPGCIGNDTGSDADPSGSEAANASLGPLADARWGVHDPAPSERTEVVAAPLQPGSGQFLVIGGFVTGQSERIVELYDARTDTWQDAPSYPIPIYHTAALSVDGQVTVFGGHSSPAFTPQDAVFAYDEGDEAWTLETQLPVPRGAHDAALLDGKVYVVGGNDDARDTIARVDVYDVEAGEWTRAPDLPNPRDHLATVAANGTVYAIGGRNVSLDANTGQVHALDPGDDAWRQVASMPTPRGGMGAELVDGHVVVAGGERSDGTFATVEAYDLRNDTWASLPDMPTARHGIATAVFGDRFYTFMGGPEPNVARSDAVESLG